MKIIDSYDEIIKLIDSMQNSFDLEQWRKYAAKISAALPQKLVSDSSAYSFENDILPTLQYAMKKPKELAMLHSAFLRTTKDLGQKAAAAFGIDLDIDIILYLGLCNGAGWATSLDGRKAILIGAEKVLELGWHTETHMRGLIYHELGHIWHKAAGMQALETTTQRDKSLAMLYTEGIAMYCEQLLCGDFSFYHQDSNGWLNWCRQNKSLLFKEFLRRTDANESTADFFGDWNEYMGHSDTGYFLGAELIQMLAEEYPLSALAKLSSDIIYKKLQSVN